MHPHRTPIYYKTQASCRFTSAPFIMLWRHIHSYFHSSITSYELIGQIQYTQSYHDTVLGIFLVFDLFPSKFV